MPKSKIQQLISGRLLALNTVYSLVGQGVPLLAAVFTIPILIKEMGTDRFGILTLAWMVVSYFSLFDLGLGRALTQLVAESIGKEEDENEIAKLIWTASFLMVGLGLIGSGLFIAISPWIVYSVLKLPQDLQQETLIGFRILALSIPAVTISAGFNGVLSALQRFDLINAIRIPLGLFTFIGPLVALSFSTHLAAVMIVLVVGRFIFGGIYCLACFRTMPLLREISFSRELISPLLRFGSWMTMSNIVSPFMASMDRFLIGSVISITAVTYYTTPYELVTKVLIVPTALVSVLFPAFSTAFGTSSKKAGQIFDRGVKLTFLILYPIIFLIVLFAPDGLNLWLGKEFALNSSSVLEWLAIGVLINGLAQVPFALIQGIGRPDLTAKLHFIELPIYAIALWHFTSTYGIVGAAYTWTFRVTLDFICLTLVSRHFLKRRLVPINMIPFVLSASLTFLLPLMIFVDIEMINKTALYSLILIVFLSVSWLIILTSEDKNTIKNFCKLY
ncbi:MAG: flippase [Thermosynechococcaceae cyanobacterium]